MRSSGNFPVESPLRPRRRRVLRPLVRTATLLALVAGTGLIGLRGECAVTITNWTGGTSTDFENAGNWDNGVPANVTNTTSGYVATFMGTPPANMPTLTMSRSITGLNFTTPTAGWTLNPSAFLLTIGSSGILGGTSTTSGQMSGVDTINANIFIAAGQSWGAGSISATPTVGQGATLIVNGAVSGLSTSALTLGITNNIAATGTIVLTGNNTYAGQTNISSAVIDVNSATAFGTGTVAFAANNALIDNTTGAPLTLINNNPILYNAALNFLGSSDLNLGTGAVTFGTSANHNASVAAGTLTIGGAITSATTGSIVKIGAGTLVLSGNNSAFTGGVDNRLGTVVITNANSLGTGTYTFDTGVLQASGGAISVAAPAQNSNGTVSGTNSLTFTGLMTGCTGSAGNNKVLTNNISGGGSLTFTGNTYQIAPLATAGTWGSTLTGSGNTIISEPIVNFAGGGTSVGNITYSGTGTLTLSGANTYTGTTTVNSGKMILASTAADSSGTLKVAAGAALATTVSNALGTGAITLAGGALLNAGSGLTQSGLGTLTVNTATSTLDFGAGTPGTYNFAATSAAWTNNLNILNWTGTPLGGNPDHLFFGTTASGLLLADLNRIFFFDSSGTSYGAVQLSSGEVVANATISGAASSTPEPTGIALLAAGMGISLLGVRRRKSLSSR